MGLSGEYEPWEEDPTCEVFDDVMESPVAIFVDDDELSRIMESEAGFLTTDLAVAVRGVLAVTAPRRCSPESWRRRKPGCRRSLSTLRRHFPCLRCQFSQPLA